MILLACLFTADAAEATQAAEDAAANCGDHRRHPQREDQPEPPDGLTGAPLALGHHVGARVICDAGSAVEFGEPLSDGCLSVIEDLSGVTFLVISKQMS